jgi:hypothetical protein
VILNFEHSIIQFKNVVRNINALISPENIRKDATLIAGGDRMKKENKATGKKQHDDRFHAVRSHNLKKTSF